MNNLLAEFALFLLVLFFLVPVTLIISILKRDAIHPFHALSGKQKEDEEGGLEN